jgi:methionyl-tRNA formyltransferase
VQWAIIRGEPRTGVAVMRMEAGLDTGPVAAVAETPIGDDETAGQLFPRLARLGAELLAATLPRILDGSVVLAPQDDALATIAPLLKKEDGRLDFTQAARQVSARARGVDPWPGATALLDGETVKLFGPQLPRMPDGAAAGQPGRVLGIVDEGLAVACADGPIAFAELQLPGRRRLPAAAVVAGRAIPPGTRLAPG